MSVPRPAAFFLAAAVLTATPRPAHCAACCGESHGLGERLGASERAAVTASARFRERFGSWRSDGAYGSMAEDDYEREIRTDVGWLVRVEPDFQLGASLPVLATFKSLGGASSAGGGLGDVSAIARWDAIPPSGWRWLPGIALTLGATIPTGRGSAASKDVVAADVTGVSAGELEPGIAIEKDWSSGWYALALATLAARIPSRDDGREVVLAPRLSFAALGGHTWEAETSLGIGVLHEREGAPSIDGMVAAGADRSRTAALLFGAHDVTPRWTALASVVADVPAAGLGRNESGGIAVSLGLRYVWRSWD